ncbi:MAG TPA: hypothetical protein VG368_00445, partial [Acidimicrobiales bacterium]|nr:hypothetical protein [Acidimicrobiales bacterium]
RRGVPLEAHDLSTLDAGIVSDVTTELRIDPRDPDELHDFLLGVVIVSPMPEFGPLFRHLVARGRAITATVEGSRSWIAIERRDLVELIAPAATYEPDARFDGPSAARDRLTAVTETVRGHLQHRGPVDIETFAATVPGLAAIDVERALITLEGRGEVLRVLETQWCAKRIVARIHARQRDRERRRYPAVGIADFMRFLVAWQHVTPGSRVNGPGGLATVINQLQGVEAAVGAWEESILPARITGFAHHLVDELAHHGELGWGRLTVKTDRPDGRRASATPSRATPVALVTRSDLPWLLAAARGECTAERPTVGAASEILDLLEQEGALFFSDLCVATGRMPVEIAEALWDGVARGLVTADGFGAVRTLLAGRYRNAGARPSPRYATRRLGRSAPGPRSISPSLAGGRWSILRAAPSDAFEPDELAEATATQLLERWGVALRELYVRESFSVPWRDVLWALRRFEARGLVRGGRFVAGPVGEQFALPEALDRLRRITGTPGTGAEVRVSASDPLNLTGILIPGPRVPAVRGRFITIRDGIPKEDAVRPLLAVGHR